MFLLYMSHSKRMMIMQTAVFWGVAMSGIVLPLYVCEHTEVGISVLFHR